MCVFARPFWFGIDVECFALLCYAMCSIPFQLRRERRTAILQCCADSWYEMKKGKKRWMRESSTSRTGSCMYYTVDELFLLPIKFQKLFGIIAFFGGLMMLLKFEILECRIANDWILHWMELGWKFMCVLNIFFEWYLHTVTNMLYERMDRVEAAAMNLIFIWKFPINGCCQWQTCLRTPSLM